MMIPGIHRTVVLIALMMMIVVNGDLFTSTAKLKQLISTEDELVKNIQDYLYNEKQRLNSIESMITHIQSERSTRGLNEPSVNIGHPVEAFMLIRRLRKHWLRIKYNVSLTDYRDSYLESFEQYNSSISQYPSQDDYVGAAEAILRLQRTYKLQTLSLANGSVLGKHQSPPLLADDCFDIGYLASRDNSSDQALEWLAEAKLRLNNSHTNRRNKTTIMKVIATVLYKQDRIHETLETIYKIMKLDPNNTFAAEMIKTCKESLRFEELKNYGNEAEFEVYGALCRGEEAIYKKPKTPSKLRCRYANYGRPRLFIRPAKEEVLFDEPRIIYYHDILTNMEIELLKERALPDLHRSIIQDSGVSKIRISSVAWLNLYGSEDPLRKILPRVQDYTGLSTRENDTERFQVANYGLGGYYVYHYDDTSDGITHSDVGKRIATVLFYLSDVDEGGATVFTQAGVRVSPVKGSAVFWHNFLKNGDIDIYTRHAGCPVLMGTKWAANLWIHEYGQVFRRRCGLTQDDKY